MRSTFARRILPFPGLLPALVLSGCALDPIAGGGLFTSNAAKPHIYTPEEQAGMTPEGTIPTMLAPSELRAYFENKNKTTPPTGEVNFCGAGAAPLIQARRNEALTAIAEVCGGADQYRIRREGPGFVKARYLGSTQLTPSCTNSQAIVFRCSGTQPKPDLRK
jgi:hypothetical protein